MRLLLCVFFFIHFSSFTQNVFLKGKVLNAKDKTPLPFAIVSIKGSRSGTLCDSAGNFVLQLKKSDNINLIISLIGFKKLSKRVVNPSEFQIFELTELPNKLDEVLVKPAENPAWEIIRHVMKNKNLNDPDKLDEYQTQAYTKVVLSSDKFVKKVDSTIKIEKITWFVLENSSSIYYKRPNKKEIVRATVATLPDFTMPNMFITNELNQFSFYSPFYQFRLLGFGESTSQPTEKLFVNPVGSYTFSQYDFELSDTLRNAEDSTFIINFKPYQGKKFNALIGTLYINSKNYAIEKVMASPADTFQVVQFKINFEYKKIAECWVPSRLKTSVDYTYDIERLRKILGRNAALTYEISSVFFDFKPNVVSDSIHFDGGSRETLSNADKYNYKTFEPFRKDSLLANEKQIYKALDSDKKNAFSKFIKWGDKPLKALFMNGLEVGKFQFLFNQTDFNNYEKLRIGLGVQNNMSKYPKFKVLGSLAYGLGDKTLKYEGVLAWNITRNRYNRIEFFYKKDIELPAQIHNLGANLIYMNVTPLLLSTQKFYVDNFQKFGLGIYIKPWAWTQVQFFAQHQQINPTYTYAFNGESIFHTNEIGFKLRYARRENINRVGGLLEMVSNKFFPVLNFQVVRGVKNESFDGIYAYWKISGDISQQIRTKKIGTSFIQISVGVASGSLPYPLLYNSLAGNTGFATSTSSNFQSMNFVEYAFNDFAAFKFRHNFGKILLHSNKKWTQPEFSIFHNVAWGILKNPSEHSIIFTDLPKGYLEVGGSIQNLLRVRFFGSYLGFGVGCAYHYSLQNEVNDSAKRLVIYPVFGLGL